MKKTRLLILSAFASLAITACGGSGSSVGPSNKNPGELPSGGSVINVDDQKGQEALASALDNLLNVRKQETPKLYKGMEVDINATNQSAKLNVSDIKVTYGSIEMVTPFGLDVNLKKAGGKAAIKLASREDNEYSDMEINVSDLNLNLAVNGTLPDFTGLITGEPISVSEMITKPALKINESLAVSDFGINAYLDGEKGAAYLDYSSKNVRNVFTTVSNLVNKVTKSWMGEALGLDLNQLVDLYTPTRKIMMDTGLEIAGIGDYSLSPFAYIPEDLQLDGQTILGYLAMAKALATIEFKSYSNGDLGLKIAMDKDQFKNIILLVAQLAFKEDLSQNEIFNIVFEAISKLDFEFSVVINNEGLITFVSQKLDVVAGYELKDLVVYEDETSGATAKLGAKFTGEIHEGVSLSAKYGDIKVSLPKDLDKYQEVELDLFGRTKPYPYDPIPTPYTPAPYTPMPTIDPEPQPED